MRPPLHFVIPSLLLPASFLFAALPLAQPLCPSLDALAPLGFLSSSSSPRHASLFSRSPFSSSSSFASLSLVYVFLTLQATFLFSSVFVPFLSLSSLSVFFLLSFPSSSPFSSFSPLTELSLFFIFILFASLFLFLHRFHPSLSFSLLVTLLSSSIHSPRLDPSNSIPPSPSRAALSPSLSSSLPSSRTGSIRVPFQHHGTKPSHSNDRRRRGSSNDTTHKDRARV